MTEVAIVTGANKGIGFAIVKGLCEKFQGKVYLTARDEKRGLAAVSELNKLGFQPVFHQLDISDQKSIDKFRDHIKKIDGGIDVLINNASICDYNASEAEITLQVNYFGTLHACETLFPLLRPNARVINLSSSVGHLSRLPSPELRSAIGSPTLTVEQLNKLMNQFLRDVKEGKHVEKGWVLAHAPAYSVSKIGISALTRLQQKEIAKDSSRKGISINSVHPGFVDTDLSRHRGPLTIEEGAKSTLFLALEPHNIYGEFVWKDCSVVDWYASETPSSY